MRESVAYFRNLSETIKVAVLGVGGVGDEDTNALTDVHGKLVRSVVLLTMTESNKRILHKCLRRRSWGRPARPPR